MKNKIVLCDIETSPNIVYSWSIGPKIPLTVDNIIEERKIICVCWKYAGESKVYSLTWDPKTQCDKKMVKAFREVLDGCDIAVGHNGDNFDIKWLQTRILYHNLPPVTNLVTADTLKFARNTFNFNSNKLDYIGQYLGVGKKVETGGFQLWKDVMAGHKKALDKMVKYCKGDVVLLEKIFNKMLPYVKSAPFNMSLILRQDRDGCPRCGTWKVHKHGLYYSKALAYQKYKCQDCGHVFRDSRALRST